MIDCYIFYHFNWYLSYYFVVVADYSYTNFFYSNLSSNDGLLFYFISICFEYFILLLSDCSLLLRNLMKALMKMMMGCCDYFWKILSCSSVCEIHCHYCCYDVSVMRCLTHHMIVRNFILLFFYVEQAVVVGSWFFCFHYMDLMKLLNYEAFLKHRCMMIFAKHL